MNRIKFAFLLVIIAVFIAIQNLTGLNVLEATVIVFSFVIIVEVLNYVFRVWNDRKRTNVTWGRKTFQFLIPPLILIYFLLVSLCIKVAWYFLVSPSSVFQNEEILKNELLARKNYLIEKIINPNFGPEDSPELLSQEFKEEWAIGSLSMLGSALTNIAFKYPEYRDENVRYLKQLIERMLKKDIKIYENRYWNEDPLESLDGPNGHIGYLGHLNYLIGAYRILGGGLEFEKLHADISTALARRIKNSPHHFLETFPGRIFIPDNSVVIVSLKLFNLSHGSETFQAEIELWLDYAKKHLLDSNTQILLPWINNSGKGVGKPRGSYATWNIFYLMQVDQEFSRMQSNLVKKFFLQQVGLSSCGIREYVHGDSGPGDVDSGPIILGISTSGTGFGLATAHFLEDVSFQKCLLSTAEIIGSTIKTDNKSRYLIAPLIGDAIVLAMRTATPWDNRFNKGK